MLGFLRPWKKKTERREKEKKLADEERIKAQEQKRREYDQHLDELVADSLAERRRLKYGLTAKEAAEKTLSDMKKEP